MSVGSGKFLFVVRKHYAKRLVSPFSKVNHFAALTAKGTKRIAGIPRGLFAATRTRHDGAHDVRLQKVKSKATSSSNKEDFAS